jgi:hypothetical protein
MATEEDIKHRSAAYQAQTKGLNSFNHEERGHAYREAAGHYEKASNAAHPAQKSGDMSSAVSMHKLARDAFRQAAQQPRDKDEKAKLKSLVREHGANAKALGEVIKDAKRASNPKKAALSKLGKQTGEQRRNPGKGRMNALRAESAAAHAMSSDATTAADHERAMYAHKDAAAGWHAIGGGGAAAEHERAMAGHVKAASDVAHAESARASQAEQEGDSRGAAEAHMRAMMQHRAAQAIAQDPAKKAEHADLSRTHRVNAIHQGNLGASSRSHALGHAGPPASPSLPKGGGTTVEIGSKFAPGGKKNPVAEAKLESMKNAAGRASSALFMSRMKDGAAESAGHRAAHADAGEKHLAVARQHEAMGKGAVGGSKAYHDQSAQRHMDIAANHASAAGGSWDEEKHPRDESGKFS